MHMGACKDYTKLYIMLSPNHAFAYNIVALHHQLHVMFFTTWQSFKKINSLGFEKNLVTTFSYSFCWTIDRLNHKL
jgi:hypothetical protein